MKFPKQLIKKGRNIIPNNKIKSRNLMFARHKPGYDWNNKEGFPDFSKIKVDQSFNWSAYSIPIWARFNDKKEYKADYGIVGYSVGVIREPRIFEGYKIKVKPEVFHVPLEFNYSHCQLDNLNNLPKDIRRNIRYSFRNKCVISILPNQEISKLAILKDLIKMYYHRLLSSL